MTRRRPLPPHLAGRPFSTRAALDAGVSAGRIRAADLDAPTSGARTPRGGDAGDRRRAILLALRDDAFLCGASAAAEYELPLPWRLNPIMEVGVPWPARAPRRAGVVARSLRIQPHELVRLDGARTTSPERTFCELAARLTVPELVAVADALPPSLDLSAAVERYPDGRMRPKLSAALALRDPRRESPKESELLALVCLAGLPAPEPQAVIADASGRFIARVDALFAEYGEILEYQGDHHRSELRQWRRDRTREAELEALGFHVTEVTQADLLRPRELIGRLAATLRRRGWAGAPRFSRWFPAR